MKCDRAELDVGRSNNVEGGQGSVEQIGLLRCVSEDLHVEPGEISACKVNMPHSCLGSSLWIEAVQNASCVVDVIEGPLSIDSLDAKNDSLTVFVAAAEDEPITLHEGDPVCQVRAQEPDVAPIVEHIDTHVSCDCDAHAMNEVIIDQTCSPTQLSDTEIREIF